MGSNNTNSIADIQNFGRGDAYKDDRLQDCFLDTPVYTMAIQGQILMVEGGKGSGKSAILKYIEQNYKKKDECFTLLLSDKDYKAGLGKANLTETGTDDITQMWTANLWVELIKTINAEKEQFPAQVKTHLDRIANLIKYNTEVDQDFIPRFVRFLKRITNIEIPYIGGGITLNPISDQFVKKLADIKTHVKKVLKTKKVFLLIDDTDSFLDVLGQKYNVISGLIGAVDGLREELLSSEDSLKDLVILVSIRSDILSEISVTYDRINNLRDFIKPLKWDKQDLKNLIAKRIKKLKSLECDADTAWEIVFEQQLNGKKVSTFDYILERSFYRPRDMLQFCNLALEEAKSTNNKKITMQNIKEAEKIYSKQKYEDISAEYLHKYGEKLSDTLLAPFKTSKANLSAFDLENTIIRKIITARAKPTWLTLATTKEDVIEIMYQIGILGVREGADYVFSFQKEMKDFEDKEFQIHKAFHSYLNIS